MKDPQIHPDEAPALYRNLTIARTTALASYAGLLLVFTLTNLFGPDGGVLRWLVQSVPLLIFIPGFVQQRHRTYSWLCFVILLYFAWSVTNVMSPFAYWRDWVVLVLTVSLFITAMMASRWLQHWQVWLGRQLS